jgi:hypothetical protein
MMEIASTKDKQELERLEEVIQKNIGAFYEVGRALMKIRDQGYYHDVLGFETFKEYCRTRWDMARQTAYQLIDSASVIENVRNCGQTETIPTNEYQARPLSKIKDPEQQREAWQKAVSTAPDGKVTAAHVYKIVKGMTMDDAKPKKEQKKIAITEAMGISTFIICHMERIREDDPKRDEALKKILNWCKENIRERS